jgi:basic amino acid/polyamine antiporter, APA family
VADTDQLEECVAESTTTGEMKRSLTLTGVTVNAMALIAPGAFLWTTFQAQAALTHHGKSTANEMWTGLFFSLILALLTAYSYAELARIYPSAGTGSSYYFAEAAFLDKEKPEHQRMARMAKLSVGWISHLYYWIYPGIMVAFTATLFGYIYSALVHHTLTWLPISGICVLFGLLVGYIAYRGISGSTLASIVVNVVQIVTLVAISIVFIGFRLAHPHAGYELVNAGRVVIPHNFINMLYQSTVAILLLVGFESVTALGAEAINPDKDIKRGVLLSLIIQGGICYLFEYFAANFAVGTATIAISDSATPPVLHTGYDAAGNAKLTSAPIGNMIHTIFENHFSHTGTTVSVLVAFTVLLALIGTTLACLNTGVRVTYSMAKDKEMPSILGFLHGKYATPHSAIWIITGVAIALGIYGANPYQVDNLTQITVASNTGTFLVYGATCLIAVIAFASRHDHHPVKHLVLPGLGALMNIGELLGVFYVGFSEGTGTTPGDYIKAIGVVVVWIVLGIIWVAANPNKHQARSALEAKKVEGSIAISSGAH